MLALWTKLITKSETQPNDTSGRAFSLTANVSLSTRAGLSKCGARLETLLRGRTQWREQKYLSRASSHNHRNHEWYERARPEKGNAKLGCLRACPHFHLSRRDFPCLFDGHVHNTQSIHELLHSIPPLWPGTYPGIRQANWPCVKWN